MFKLVVFLCLGLYAVLFVMGRDGGPVRDGLAGRVTPLMAPRDAVDAAAPQVAEAAAEPAVIVPVAAQAATPEPAAPAAPQPALLPASLTDDGGQTGLTLALPLVDADARPPEAQAETSTAAELPAGIPDEPLVMYVNATSVNVRSGPSAETEALTRLPRGEAVLVLPSDTPGWSMIRLEGDGVEGYIASRFLGGRPDNTLFEAVD
jgi:uncharacterized protein YgiM (DUF1202 family)